jgi:hypothetical protein
LELETEAAAAAAAADERVERRIAEPKTLELFGLLLRLLTDETKLLEGVGAAMNAGDE